MEDRIGREVHAGPPDPELLDRFVQRRDEQAFAALVRRYGGMVFGVCRRILENSQDAEDALQATFVVLARRAHVLTRPELLAGWLYGVAYRTARKVRAKAVRRSFHERQAALRAATEYAPLPEEGWEVRARVQREIQHLPDKYRMPLVLCYLQGLTNQQAAMKLGWPSGSISYRLARGREMLRDRLKSISPVGRISSVTIISDHWKSGAGREYSAVRSGMGE
jgi:RNA polymerase sigma factor (sigma-70 family)